jgi:hypothetical protein
MLFLVSPLKAQNSDDQPEVKKNNPTAFQFVPRPLPKEKKSDEASFHYEDLYLKKTPKSSATAYKATEIERAHYIDNPFDIDDFSNPFNLPRAGSRQRLASQQSLNQQKKTHFFKDLFAIENAESTTLATTQTKLSTPSWIFFLCIGLLGFFTYLLTIYRDQVKKSFGSFFSMGSAQQQLREQQNPFSPYSVAVYFLFALGVGAFALIAVNSFTASATNPPNWSIGFYLLLSASVAAVYFLKYGQLFLVGVVFPIRQELQYYSFMLSNTNRLLAMAIVPLLFLVAYTPENLQNIFLYSSLAIISLLYFFAAIRTILVARETILFHKFHFFIYLCSVEIAPALILMKLISII